MRQINIYTKKNIIKVKEKQRKIDRLLDLVITLFECICLCRGNIHDANSNGNSHLIHRRS